MTTTASLTATAPATLNELSGSYTGRHRGTPGSGSSPGTRW